MLQEGNFRDEIKSAVEVLRTGGIILYPTDTVWGIGCDATNEKAVEKVFKIKKRDPGKSLILLVDSDVMLERYVEDIPDIAFDLIETSDSPLTIIYDKGLGLAKGVCANDGSVGIRLTKEKYSSALVKALRRPIVSTSANFSGDATPRIFSEINEILKSEMDFIANYRREDNTLNEASHIIKLSEGGVIKIIR